MESTVPVYRPSDIACCQPSAPMYMISAFLWDITQRRVVIPCWRFGTELPLYAA